MSQPPWKAWYKLAQRRALRLRIFLRDLYTSQRRACGRIQSNTVLLTYDQVIPHRGDERLFWDDRNLQTVSKSCYDSVE